MPATIIDGRAIAADIKKDVAQRAHALATHGIIPKCVAVVAEGDSAGLLYAQTAKRAGAEAGIEIEIVPVGAGADTAGAIAIVARVVEEPTAHGVIIQRPLPKKVDESRVIDALDLKKDVDCSHPQNIGLLAIGAPRYVPATAAAVLELLSRPPVRPIAGARVTIIGRSPVVGRPAALLLTAADATVTLCHSKTAALAEETKRADIIVVAAGRPNLLTADMIADGATVIDVGTNVVDGRLVGDVDKSVREKAGAMTLVPGGVGPVTTAVLLRNVIEAAERAAKH